eukprot:1688391-Pyramimonas_sp.AAC.1
MGCVAPTQSKEERSAAMLDALMVSSMYESQAARGAAPAPKFEPERLEPRWLRAVWEPSWSVQG